ncbi:hypothetical protein NL53_17745 [Vibrio variabilis]|uniref:Uncharacterized protein n=1 Tax=Vibrio variabilis TaxID=990271 RepID=A0ABR4Y6S9_9VIBR|nr:hypothetical protein [Vibrio variabilis]KHA59183.1 hypothetical protein NL53_17745 [Vibrio variabilis]
MKIRYSVYIFVFVFSFLYLGVFSGVNIYQSIYRDVSELHLKRLTPLASNTSYSEQTLTLQSKIAQFAYPLSHDYLINATLLGWVNYSYQTFSNVANIEDQISIATGLRPTWSPAYTQLFHLYWRVGNEDKAIEMLILANMFGPNRIETILTNVDYTFTNWLFASQEDRLRASKQLLTISESWKHHSELNQMITYSLGKQRICNMLAFNKVKVSACQ